jgi:hypothetical protein
MHDPDPLLLYLVGNFELLAKDGHQTPRVQLELLVGGVVVIGTLISSVEFSEQSHRIMQALFKIRADVVDETARQWHVSHSDVEGKIPVFLHLSGVEFWPHNLVQSSDWPSTELWRVRISSVDSFHISDPFEIAEDLKPDTQQGAVGNSRRAGQSSES